MAGPWAEVHFIEVHLHCNAVFLVLCVKSFFSSNYLERLYPFNFCPSSILLRNNFDVWESSLDGVADCKFEMLKLLRYFQNADVPYNVIASYYDIDFLIRNDALQKIFEVSWRW